MENGGALWYTRPRYCYKETAMITRSLVILKTVFP